MSGSRRSVPSPEQGASTSTQSNTAQERQSAARASACTTRTRRAAGPGRCAPAARPAGRARRRRRSVPASPIAAAIAVVLPPGDAQASSTLARPRRRRTRRRAATLRPGRRTGLLARAASAGDCPRDDQPVRRERGRLGRRRLRRARSLGERVARRPQRLARSVSGAGWLLNCSHASAASNPYRSSQRCREPPRMRQRGLEIVERCFAVCGGRRARRQRQRLRSRDTRRSTALTNRRAPLARLARQIHRIVDDRRRRDASR